MALLKKYFTIFPQICSGADCGQKGKQPEKKLKFNPHLLLFPTAPLTKIRTKQQNTVFEFSKVEKERNVEATR
jgi:hypothetical protein